MLLAAVALSPLALAVPQTVAPQPAWHFVEAVPGVQVGKAEYLYPTESWNAPNNIKSSLAACEQQCLGLAACRYGTFITSGARKGECWLSAHTHEGSDAPSCGVPCQGFTKVPGLSPTPAPPAPTPAPTQRATGHIPNAMQPKHLQNNCQCDPHLHPSAFTRCRHDVIGDVMKIQHLARKFHTVESGDNDQHKCAIQKGTSKCNCCDCKMDFGAIDIDHDFHETTGDFHQILPPYLGTPGKPMASVAQCQLACSANLDCKYGTLLVTEGEAGACYLSSHGMKKDEPCISKCHSFKKIAFADGWALRKAAKRAAMRHRPLNP